MTQNRQTRWASVIPNMDDKLGLVKHLESILASKLITNQPSEHKDDLNNQDEIHNDDAYGKLDQKPIISTGKTRKALLTNITVDYE